jgi:hypothetical protein
MKKLTFISIFCALIILSMLIPASAMSSRAEDFLKACRTLDAPFPPKTWSNQDIRLAALEILDAIEAKQMSLWPRTFCVIALGSVKNPADLPRILAYEDEMPNTVLQSLKGFSHPDAINYLIRHLSSDEDSTRELSVIGLAEMKFDNLDEPMVWYTKVSDALKSAQKKETESWLKEDMQKAISNLKKPQTGGTT